MGSSFINIGERASKFRITIGILGRRARDSTVVSTHDRREQIVSWL
jgi:hypothetical protein